VGRRGFWNAMMGAADLDTEPRPGEPLVEMAGQGRVLIENHMGVMGYGTEEICVKVKFGQVIVSGTKMILSRMTQSQLLITGCIDSVRFCRREV